MRDGETIAARWLVPVASSTVILLSGQTVPSLNLKFENRRKRNEQASHKET
jgi:hypothetical protein